MTFFDKKGIQLAVGILIFILVGGSGVEILARAFVGLSPFVEPFTALERVGMYKAPDTAVGFYPENLMGDFAVQDGRLYVSDFGSHLRVIDASNPANLREIAVLPLEYEPGIAGLIGTHIFLTRFPHLEAEEKPEGKSEKIEIFDISDLKNIKKVGEYTPQCDKLCSIFDSVIVADGVLFLFTAETDHFNGPITKATIQILDITNPRSVSKKAEIQVPEQAGYSFSATGNYIGILEEEGFRLFSRENTENYDYELASMYKLPRKGDYGCREFNNIAIQENIVYLLEQYGDTSWCGNTALHLVDVSNPKFPTELGKFEFKYNAGEFEVMGNYVFVGNRARGMRVIDVSNPAAPRETTHYTRFSTPFYQEIWQMEIDGEYAYVVGHQVLAALKRIDVVDISNL